MKTVSIRDLHAHTGRLVRAAAREPILVTDRGRTVAVLQAATAARWVGHPFPKRDRTELPWVGVDSTGLISDDRER